MNKIMIKTTSELASFCRPLLDLKDPSFIAVDTEFIRENTYRPQLCLIQVATPDTQHVIDPLADNLDLSPFWALMDHPSLTKVFHAARQDIEIVYHHTKRIPRPLFDTQIAAMMEGARESISYEDLVWKTLSHRVKKGERLTDWSLRPLSDAQLTYAMEDVIHLRSLYLYFKQAFEKNKRKAWLEEELGKSYTPDLYENTTEEAWRKVKGSGKFCTPRRIDQWRILKGLSTWRETQAQQRNLPRRRILTDEVICLLTESPPTRIEDFTNARFLHRVPQRLYPPLLSCIKTARASQEIPDFGSEDAQRAAPNLVALFQIVLNVCAQQANIAPSLLASTRDLKCLITQDQPDIPTMKDWRFQIFGAQALRFKRGELHLAYRDNQLCLIPSDHP